ncbi:MAG: PPC domain-containing protein, partial [Gammaproteobacteria bacterium]|nr:PPC domain-containing protein [Gammaproteobacteria bacterium]
LDQGMQLYNSASVHVNAQSHIELNSDLTVADQAVVKLYTDADINIDGSIAITSAADGSLLHAKSLSVGENLTLAAYSKLQLAVAEISRIAGDLSLQMRSLLMLNGRYINNFSSLQPHQTVLVTGAVNIADTATISADGQGHRNSNSQHYQLRCHAGFRAPGSMFCADGSYDQALTAGRDAAGNSRGGGVINLKAGSIHLDGNISAVGENGSSSNFRLAYGSGGSVRLETSQLTGAGQISTIGAQVNRSGIAGFESGGGRIAVFSADNQFSGRYLTAPDALATQAAGAGTVYLASNVQTAGQLIVDNGQQTTALATGAGTALAQPIGRWQVGCVRQQAENQWRVIPQGYCDDEWGNLWPENSLTNRQISSNADTNDAPLLRIIANSSTSLLVQSEQDLNHLVGNYIVGVYQFSSLQLLNHAYLQLGEDHLRVLDTASSIVHSNSRLLLGGANTQLRDLLAQSGADVRYLEQGCAAIYNDSYTGLPAELRIGSQQYYYVSTSDNDRLFSFNVPQGAEFFNVSIRGRRNSWYTPYSDIYVRFAEAPTTATYDCKAAISDSTTELCRIDNPAAGTYYLLINERSSNTSGYLTANAYITGCKQ